MKEKLKKYLPLIIFGLSFVLDANYGILEKFIVDPFWINIIKGLGAFMLAYLTEKNLGIIKSNTMTHFITVEKEATPEQAEAIQKAIDILASVGLEIAGGGIKNPKNGG